MTFTSALLLVISLVTFVAGQLLLKRAMEPATPDIGGRRIGWLLAAGVLAMAVSFFLTQGLLQRFDLSFLYPFQGATVIVVIAAAAVVLRERITLPLAIGSTLIAAGVVLVALS